MQEVGERALDELRRRRHLQHACVAAPKQPRALADCLGVIQQSAAIDEQLLAFAGQDKPAPHAVEELEPELVLQFADLPRQRGLGNAQVQRRP